LRALHLLLKMAVSVQEKLELGIRLSMRLAWL